MNIDFERDSDVSKGCSLEKSVINVHGCVLEDLVRDLDKKEVSGSS